MAEKKLWEKIIVRKKYTASLIGQWVKLKGFPLSSVAIQEHLFDTVLNLVLGTFDDFKAFIEKEFDYTIEKIDPLAFYFCYKGYRWMVVDPKMEFTYADYGILAHELYHHAYRTLDDRGLTPGKDSEETYAYFMGYHMEMVCRAILELKKYVKSRKKKRKR